MLYSKFNRKNLSYLFYSQNFCINSHLKYEKVTKVLGSFI